MAGQPVHEAQAVDGIGLPGPVAQVAVDRPGLLEGSRGSRQVAAQGLRVGQQHESPSLARQVTGLAGCGKSALMQSKALVPLPPGFQEVSHGGRDQHGVPGCPVAAA